MRQTAKYRDEFEEGQIRIDLSLCSSRLVQLKQCIDGRAYDKWECEDILSGKIYTLYWYQLSDEVFDEMKVLAWVARGDE